MKPVRGLAQNISAVIGAIEKAGVQITEDGVRYLKRDRTCVTGTPTGLRYGPTMGWSERDLHSGPTPRALQGDDVQLEYYEDGYPKLPACPGSAAQA